MAALTAGIKGPSMRLGFSAGFQMASGGRGEGGGATAFQVKRLKPF